MERKTIGVILCVVSSLILITLLFHNSNINKENQNFCNIACNEKSNICTQIKECPFVIRTPLTFTLSISLLIIMFGFGLNLIITKDFKSKEKELSIIKKALSNDEKLVVDEVKKAEEITQDSLRFRLGWSKAKLSAIVNNLDRLNLIQREKQGKTYKIFIK